MSDALKKHGGLLCYTIETAALIRVATICNECIVFLMNKSERLEKYLESLAKNARPGDKVPTVRTLMSEFGVSQSVVQRCTEKLKAEGRITAEAGRGTFFTGVAKGEEPAAPSNVNLDHRTVLFLQRATYINRGRRALELLHNMLQQDGCRIVEVSYTDNRDAVPVLRGLPRFDACVIQTSFETVSIEMLSAVRQKASAIVVDGALLSGTEVDAVGNEWGSAVDLALDHLMEQGHQSIAFVTSTRSLLANELGRIRFETQHTREAPGTRTVIEIPAWLSNDYEDLVAAKIAKARRKDSSFPFSAVIVLGIENGARFLRQLNDNGINVPQHLSIVLLGRPDLENEHAGFFTCAGVDTAQQAQALRDSIVRRWDEPDADYKTTYVPSHLIDRASTGMNRVKKRN